MQTQGNFFARLFYGTEVAQAGAAVLARAVDKYKRETGSLPLRLEDLTRKQKKLPQYGPWVKKDDLKDPWGNEYNYSFSSTNRQYAIWSAGMN